MAEAGPSSATMASAPFHHVAAAHRSNLTVLLTANSVQLVDEHSDGSFKTYAIPTTVFVPQPTLPDQSDAARYADNPHISFARLASFSHSDRFLALTGDDKVLRVWKLERTADGSITGFEFGKEIVIKLLPKRAAVLHWMSPSDSTPSGSEELVCIDRFGDVRSFLINENDVRTLPSANKAEAAVADEQDEMDSPTDATMQILLGHVSMVTSLAFIPASKPTAPPAFIITGDRDEHIRISRWGSKRTAYVIDRYLQGSEAFVGALAVVSDQEAGGKRRLISSEGGRALRVWALPQHGTASTADTSFDNACLSINELSSALAPYVLARDREERKRESKALQASSKRNKAAKRKQNDDAQTAEQTEAKPLAAQYSKDSKPTIVISDLLPYQDADSNQWLLIVVEGATAFFSVPVSALLASLTSDDKVRDISDQVRVTRASAPILHLTLAPHVDATAPVSVIATFDTRPEFLPETPTSEAEAEVGIFTLTPSGAFERQANPALVDAILPATQSESAARELLDPSIVEHLGLYPALTTWPKIEVPSSAEIIATRSSRKGRFNHPLDTSMIGVAQVEQTKPSNASSNPEADDEQRRKLVKTMQGGKRERGRERNREAIRLAQEQAASQ
ncbi:tRNA (guanine-N(7)-)-methyltransferase non-catalytic subunit TRM82 [Pseudozyma hubeiensis]|nr:tRNA (guanine-N(7)-)-methyltransferase non-catalytic subunit TRM82 [Pseudozyma hubeiensis]